MQELRDYVHTQVLFQRNLLEAGVLARVLQKGRNNRMVDTGRDLCKELVYTIMETEKCYFEARDPGKPV